MALNHDLVGYMLDRLVEFKQAYWERALAEFGDLVTVACEHDDLAGQRSLLFSPDTYRSVVKPRQKKLFHFIKDHAPVKLFYHTDGAVRPLFLTCSTPASTFSTRSSSRPRIWSSKA